MLIDFVDLDDLTFEYKIVFVTGYEIYSQSRQGFLSEDMALTLYSDPDV